MAHPESFLLEQFAKEGLTAQGVRDTLLEHLRTGTARQRKSAEEMLRNPTFVDALLAFASASPALADPGDYHALAFAEQVRHNAAVTHLLMTATRRPGAQHL